MVLVAGVDEAGKGPVIGPMCVGGVLVEDAGVLVGLGLRDSKKLSSLQRERLAVEIGRVAKRVFVLEVSAGQIDELRRVMTMNEVMVLSFARVLSVLKPDVAFLDAADVNAGRFATRVGEKCGRGVKITSEHKADDKYPVVAAASIVAKVRRDELVKELAAEYGVSFGSGYPSDSRTKRFLEEWIQLHDAFPSFVRSSWKTASNLLEGKKQRRL